MFISKNKAEKFLNLSKKIILRFTKSKTNLSILIIAFFTFISKGLGFLRQIIIYQKLDPITSDLLLASDRIPNLLIQLLISGALISSILPIASDILNNYKSSNNSDLNTKDNNIKDKKVNLKNLNQYLNLILLIVISSLIFISSLVWIFLEPILHLNWVTSKQIIELFSQKVILSDYYLTTRILLLGPIFFGIQAVLNVFIFIKQRFWIYSLAGPIYNIGFILGLLIGNSQNVAYTTSLGSIIALFITTLIYYYDSYKHGFRINLQIFKFNFNLLIKIYQKLKKQFTLTAFSFLSRILVLDTAVVGSYLIGSIAIFGGEITAVEIGLSISGTFFVILTSQIIVAFPQMALAKKNQIKFWNIFRLNLKKTIIWTLFISFLGLIFIPILMQILDFLGKTSQNQKAIILAAQITTFGLVFRSIRLIIEKYFFVINKILLPVYLSLISLIFQISLTFILHINKIDPVFNISLGLVITNIIYVFIASYFVYQDWKKYQSKNLLNSN